MGTSLPCRLADYEKKNHGCEVQTEKSEHLSWGTDVTPEGGQNGPRVTSYLTKLQIGWRLTVSPHLVRLPLLTMTNPNQLCDVLFVCSKMADTSLSSKLPVADRTREVWGRKLCWWCLSSGFPMCTFLLGFADSFCFVFTSSPFYEASPLCTILCNLFPWLCWYVEVFKGGFEGVLVSLLLTTMGAFSYLKFSIENFLWQTFIRHSGNMACPS